MDKPGRRARGWFRGPAREVSPCVAVAAFGSAESSWVDCKSALNSQLSPIIPRESASRRSQQGLNKVPSRRRHVQGFAISDFLDRSQLVVKCSVAIAEQGDQRPDA